MSQEIAQQENQTQEITKARSRVTTNTPALKNERMEIEDSSTNHKN